jgi:hypothetical protein
VNHLGLSLSQPNGWALSVADSSANFEWVLGDGTNLGVIVSSAAATTGTWFQVAFSFDPAGGSNNFKTYVTPLAGTVALDTAATFAHSLVYTGATPGIGGLWYVPSTTYIQVLPGQIDLVKIYSRVLTVSDLQTDLGDPFTELRGAAAMPPSTIPSKRWVFARRPMGRS